MFTASGDQNGRHNLPGAPMLDLISGSCMILGVGVAVRHLSRWVYQLLLLWLAAALSGGILAVDGEAPQSLRSLAAMIPAVLLAALPLLLLWQIGISRIEMKRARRVLLSLALVAALALAGWLNVDRYFNRQAANLAAWEANGGARVLAAARSSCFVTRATPCASIQRWLPGSPGWTILRCAMTRAAMSRCSI